MTVIIRAILSDYDASSVIIRLILSNGFIFTDMKGYERLMMGTPICMMDVDGFRCLLVDGSWWSLMGDG